MSNVLRLAIVDPNDVSREAVKGILLGMDVVWLEAECSRYEFFADVVNQTHPDIGLINLDSNAEKGLELMSKLRDTSPDCTIVVVSSSRDGDLILRAMRNGAKEFLTQPVKVEDLVGALERLTALKFGKGDGRNRSCAIVAICGATGGVGTTSLAVNLGCAMAQEPSNSVALVDLDLALGDADVFLDTIPDYTLVDVAQNIGRLDFTLLKRSLTKHSSGLYLLPRPVHLQDAQHIHEDEFGRSIGLLKATFSHLVLDLSKGYGPLDMIALNTSNHVLLVTQLDLPCLRNVVRLMTSFGEIEGLKDKVKIVVNRVGLDSGQISLKKAQETIGQEIYWQIPNDYRVMSEVRNNGVPLVEHAPRAGVTLAIGSLAKALMGGTEETQQAPLEAESSGFGRWLNLFSSR